MNIDFSNPELYNEVYIPIFSDKKRYIFLMWWWWSWKSVAIWQWVVMYTFQTKHNILWVRKVYATIKDSVYAEIIWVIKDRWMESFFNIGKSPLEITNKLTWAKIIFRWLDDVEKIKSIKWVQKIRIEEATETTREDFDQLDLRLRWLDDLQIICTFNPVDENSYLNTDYRVNGNTESQTCLHTTYEDNRFVWDAYKKVMERLKETNPSYYKVYALWQRGTVEWLVFERYETLPDVPADARLVSYGLDFGYTNDPTAMIAVYKWNWSLVLDEIFYKRWLINVYKDIDDKIGSIVGRFEENLIDKSADIWADSSEPKSIAEIYMAWYNIKPVEKWPDSIRAWIDLMKQYNIYITSRSSNLLKEFRKYTRSQDKEGKYLNKPIDVDNHWIDASRYAVMSSFKNTFETKDRWKVYSVNAVDVLY